MLLPNSPTGSDLQLDAPIIRASPQLSEIGVPSLLCGPTAYFNQERAKSILEIQKQAVFAASTEMCAAKKQKAMATGREKQT